MDLFSKLLLSTTGINIKPTTGGEPINNGDITYNLSSNKFRKKENGSITDLDTGGGGSGITRSISTINTNTTAGAAALTDYVYFTVATLTLTLPTCVGNTNRYTVKCINGTLTINTTSSQVIDGATSIQIAVEDSVDIVSSGVDWKII